LKGPGPGAGQTREKQGRESKGRGGSLNQERREKKNLIKDRGQSPANHTTTATPQKNQQGWRSGDRTGREREIPSINTLECGLLYKGVEVFTI